MFNPKPTGGDPRGFLKERRPIFRYVGRVAAEKNVEALLELDLPGTKWVVGEGPALATLKRKYQKDVARLDRESRRAGPFVP